MIKEIKRYKLSLYLAVFLLAFAFSPIYAEKPAVFPENSVEPEVIAETTNKLTAPAIDTVEKVVEETVDEEKIQSEPTVTESEVTDETTNKPTTETVLSIDQEGRLIIEKVATPTKALTLEETEDIESREATPTPAIMSEEENEDNVDVKDFDEVKPADAEGSGEAKEATVLSAEIEFGENEPIDTKHLVNTEIIRQPVFDGPTILAQWQMSAPIPDSIIGRDDSIADGSQLLPSGGYQIDRSYSVCALLADGQGNIESAETLINYPENIALNESETKRGCGRLKNSIDLEKLTQAEAKDYLCDNIRIYNNNLISWHKDSTDKYAYNYEQVCGDEGLINRGQALVFCGEDKLKYDDPAGDYRVEITVKDDKNKINTAYNDLKIMELTMFEADFSDFQYGMVQEKNWKVVSGDTNWEKSSAPTIRNIGNTRLNIIINQNDFGFGKTDEEWNILYRARLGTNPQFTDYLPEISQIIADPLNLGDSVKMDFAVFVKHFPVQAIPAFSGQMILSAEKTAPLSCALR